MLLIRILSFVLGLACVFAALTSAIRTFILPRSSPDFIVRFVFRIMRRVFNGACKLAKNYKQRDHIMAMYAPVGLVSLIPTFMLVLGAGFALMFFGIGLLTLYESFTASGSSLLTLGFVTMNTLPAYALAFAEATIGMIMSALLIAYLPTIYSVFQKRELLVTKLEVAAGSPPSGAVLIERAYRIASLQTLDEFWRSWIDWFAELEESHTSLAPLAFFRSQQPNRSWVTSAGAMLDAAALVRSSVDTPINTKADLLIRTGYLALKYVAKPYGFQYHPDPQFPAQSIGVSQAEFDQTYDHLKKVGVPMKPDRQQCWIDFAGWRVNYDAQLLDLCALVMSPEAPWSGDRCAGRWYLTPAFKNKNVVEDSEVSADANSEDALPDSAKEGANT